MADEINVDLVKEETLKLVNRFQILDKLALDELKLLLGCNLDDFYRKRLARMVQFHSGETVIQQGEFDCWIFWVIKGHYAVVKDGLIIAEMNETGEVFGEMTVLEEEMRTASIEVTKEGLCLCLDMSVLDTFENQEIREKISQGINDLKIKRISKTNADLVRRIKRMEP
ncbi:MAG: cyclic nucleotide-binding domain-containing protein [Desulfobacteraceae bacterium]|nr:cyclic nucleotide-binding domain-containing protein [Desulfobacteraceae bacterium]